MTSILAGFVLLTIPCNNCDPVPVSEKLYQTKHQCEQMIERLNSVRPKAILTCGEVWRYEDKQNGE